MKGILYLIVGLAVGTAARSQSLPGTDSTLLQWKLQIPKSIPLSINGFPQGLDGFLTGTDPASGLLATLESRVRVMGPDNMPCRVPNLSKVERMPVRRATNADPMPNGFRRGKKRAE